jgi:hypothetical protein
MSGSLAASGWRLNHPVAIAVLAIVAFAAERESIRLSPTIEVSVASIVCIFALSSAGPPRCGRRWWVGLLADLPRRDGDKPTLRWLTGPRSA